MLLSKAANEEHHNLFIIQSQQFSKYCNIKLTSNQDYHINKTAEKYKKERMWKLYRKYIIAEVIFPVKFKHHG